MSVDPALDRVEGVAKASLSWPWRAIVETKSHTTNLGCIIIAALGKRPSLPPFYEPDTPAHIDVGGVVRATYINNRGEVFGLYPAANVEQLKDDLNRLADRLKFNDQERAELFTAIRGWIARDFRPGQVETKL